jgi:two-component system response regulator RegX3
MTPRILVVDDEPSLIEGLRYALQREQFEVEVATDGEAAVTAARDQAVDLVILDLMLPTLSGNEVCKQIRVDNAVPIIMLTAKDSERDLIEGLQAGADDYVTKPFSAKELIARVRALLRRRGLDRAAHREVIRSIGALTIDFFSDEVTIDGERVALTPSEFKILSLLATEPGSVFSRRQIMEHLWSEGGNERTFEVHVSSLRRKIERGRPERLVTMRGVGYALNAV